MDFGIDKVHNDGITGKGVRVAIIDTNGFHGDAVKSLFLNVAPGVELQFFPVSEMFPREDVESLFEKIKGEGFDIISMSSNGRGITREETEQWEKKLNDDGCTLITSITYAKSSFAAGCRDNTKNIDDAECIILPDDIGYIKEAYKTALNVDFIEENRVFIPCGGRTWKQSDGTEVYAGKSSASWNIPQVAALFALAKQVNRGLSFEEFNELAVQTASKSTKGINIINIQELIEMVRTNTLDEKGQKKTGLNDAIGDDKSRFEGIQNATSVTRGSQELTTETPDKTIGE